MDQNQNDFIDSSDLPISDYLEQLAQELAGGIEHQEELTDLRIAPSDFMEAKYEENGLMLSAPEIGNATVAPTSLLLYQQRNPVSPPSASCDFHQVLEGTSSLTISPQQTQWNFVHPDSVMSLQEPTLPDPQDDHTSGFQPETFSRLNNSSRSVYHTSEYMPLTESSKTNKSIRKKHAQIERIRCTQTSQFSSESLQPNDACWSHNSLQKDTLPESHPLPLNPNHMNHPVVLDLCQHPSSSGIPPSLRKSSKKSRVINFSEKLTSSTTSTALQPLSQYADLPGQQVSETLAVPSALEYHGTSLPDQPSNSTDPMHSSGNLFTEHHNDYPYTADCGLADTWEKVDDMSFKDVNDTKRTEYDDEEDGEDSAITGHPGASGMPDAPSFSSQDELRYQFMRQQNNVASSRYRRKKSEKRDETTRRLEELEAEHRKLTAKAEGLEKLRDEMGEFLKKYFKPFLES